MGSGSGSWGELGEQKFLRDLMKFLWNLFYFKHIYLILPYTISVDAHRATDQDSVRQGSFFPPGNYWMRLEEELVILRRWFLRARAAQRRACVEEAATASTSQYRASPIVWVSTSSKLINLNEKKVQQLALNIVQWENSVLGIERAYLFSTS
jgi:hypothetical protein